MPCDFEFAARTERIPQSGIREIFDLAQEYDDLADMSIGEPDFETPEPIAEAVSEAIGSGVGSYTVGVGREDLREALAEKLADRNAIEADPSTEIVVTPGAMGSLFAATHVLADAGDEVLVPVPYWPNYQGHLASADATLVPVPTRAENGFEPRPEDVARAITDDTAGILLNTPTNPTGAVVPPDALESIGELLIDHDLWGILDETYEDLVYGDATHHSLASDSALFERTVTIHSFSKSYAMTGWRIGYATGPADVVSRMQVLQEHTVSCAAEPSQVAALAALDNQEIVEDVHDAFARRREVVLDRLRAIDGVHPGNPRGAFYVFADVSEVADDTTAFVEYLIEEAGVATVPGTVFGESGEGFLRFSYATDETTIQEAMDRFERGVEQYR